MFTKTIIVGWVILQSLAICWGQYHDWDDVTPLDEYVNRPDEHYGYEFLYSEQEDGATVYVYNMTSQKWMDEDYIDRPIWWHQVSVAIPDQPTIFDACILFNNLGRNDDDNTNDLHERIVQLARETGAVAARIQPILNQPLYFADSPDESRIEDAIIARTWRHYIESEEEEPNPEMNALMPMAKAAKVSLDTVIEVANQLDSRFEIEKAMPYGISKYGWTSWLLACVDPRVFAVAPIVLDILNYHDNFHHHYEAYGGWSWAMSPYWNENITMYIDHPRAAEMMDDIATDPLRYNSRLTMPKLLSVASGDAFFLPDDSYYFFDELLEPKFMTVHENSGHTMVGMYDRIYENLITFFEATYYGLDLPAISWERSETGSDGTIELQTDQEPLSIRAFWADTTEVVCESDICRRDFREFVAGDIATGVFWDEDVVEDMGDNVYRVTYDKREDDGYRGFFIHMLFPSGSGNRTLDVTSEVHVIPDVLPFPRCQTEEECRGVLL